MKDMAQLVFNLIKCIYALRVEVWFSLSNVLLCIGVELHCIKFHS